MAKAGLAPRQSTSVVAAAAFVLLTLPLMSSCSAGGSLGAPISAAPSTVLELSWSKAKRKDQGVEVWGQIQQVHCCRYVRGHIHFDAKGRDGTNLASADAPWGEFNPRQIHSAWFKAVLPVPPAANVSGIEVRFVTEPTK